MTKTRLAVLLMLIALALLVPALAAAQGGLVILNAQYGNERYHVDVTLRLRELARHGDTFRVNHDSMQADPDPGHAKGLRVFVRDPNGSERFLDFPDNSVFDGGQFGGWGRADWGDEHWDGGWVGHAPRNGDYVILGARYGNERHHIDVTQRLRELARENATFRLTYHVFGDPDEGHAKWLRIYARGPNGAVRMFEYADGNIIDGAVFRGWGGGDWGREWGERWEVERH